MKIAIIGTGISGLTSAYLLSRKHEIEVFEADSRPGGHTHTLDVETRSGRYAVDTGFIVFNDWTYPNFIALMNQIGVKWQDSSMSFSVKSQKTGLEYNGTSLNSLFAQRSNLLRPAFYKMIREILRFNRESVEVLGRGGIETLGEYLERNGYSNAFKENYLIPMGAAIWSSSAQQMEEFPIEFFVRFFKNHGMLSVDERPVWRVIRGGSRSYIEPLTRGFRDRIRLGSKVISVRRGDSGATLQVVENGELQERVFDQVVFACHSDDALSLIRDASHPEREVLGAFQYQSNSTILHTDETVLPKRRLAWAAWNYLVPERQQDRVAVTYHMNILQGLKAPESFLVSLNLDSAIDPAKVIRRLEYRHPVYSNAAFQAQGRWGEISGRNRYHFAGAYWGYGFHEDGVKSAIQVGSSFGEAL